MDFLSAFEKAKELGLSKDEFLPIYMKEIKNKTDQLACQNLGLGSWNNNPDDRASSVWSSQPQSSLPDWRPQPLDAQKQSEQAVVDLDDLKVYLDSMKESLCAQLQELKSWNTSESEQFRRVQQEMKHFLMQINSDVQTLLPASQDGGLLRQDKNESSYEMFYTLLQKLNECMVTMKQNIEGSQAEIVTALYCVKSFLKDDYSTEIYKLDKQFRLQGANMKENCNNGHLAVLGGQTELSTYIKELQSLVVGTFSKICEFQNTFGATMQQQKHTQQLVLKNIADLFQKCQDSNQEGQPEMCQPENQEQYFNLPAEVCANEPGSATCSGLNSVAMGTALAKEDPDTLVDSKIISVFESSAPVRGSIISVIYDFCIQNVSNLIESRKEFQKVTYDEKLGCCLRASIHFSDDKKTEDILTFCLDICQVGRDVVLPDLLRILCELTLINGDKDFPFWNVAKEKGVFYLPKIKENGWFEVCAVFLDIQSSQFNDFVSSGTLSFYYNITVFNRETERRQERYSNLSCDSTDLCDDSYDSASEYLDADTEENKEMTRTQKSTSESSTCENEESMPQFMAENKGQDPFTVHVPCSTYFLPVCALNALVGSESIIDSQDWYLHFLGHSVHAVLAFLDDDTMVICIDHFHGASCADLPELAAYRCQVSLMDQTDRMEDLVIADSLQVFDLTEDTPGDWMKNCVGVFSCRTIENRFKNNGRIVLQFDFFDVS